jgi:hypothetical protein
VRQFAFRSGTHAVSTSLIVLVVGLALAPFPSLADVVVPSVDVTTGVIVRASASSQSAPIGVSTLWEVHPVLTVQRGPESESPLPERLAMDRHLSRVGGST